MDVAHLSEWADRKGIDVLGTGDFTHALWLAELKKNLMEDGSGLLSSKDSNLRWILSSEISCIYSQGGKTRKVHLVILAPDIATVEKINTRLITIGNLHSDGRPILGISAKDLAQVVWQANPDCLVIPAHAWTPWFSIFGSKSGFDSIEECFGELSDNIYAIETGLSSDPEMNWRLSALDNITLISNSDAHSPANLGRETNVFEIAGNITYKEIADIIKTKDTKRFIETLEFFPEEGKYHFDGHAACKLVVNPFENRYPDNRCPICGRPLTIGVANRVEELADRKDGVWQGTFPQSKHLVPLREIIASAFGVGVISRKVNDEYRDLTNRLGSEFKILLDLDEKTLDQELDPQIADAVKRVRAGNIKVDPGYDGIYGKVHVFADEDLSQKQQQTLF